MIKIYSPKYKTSRIIQEEDFSTRNNRLEVNAKKYGKFEDEKIKSDDDSVYLTISFDALEKLIMNKDILKNQEIKTKDFEEIKAETSEDEVEEDVSENSFDNEGNKFITKRKR